jgi:hypothetical protein
VFVQKVTIGTVVMGEQASRTIRPAARAFGVALGLVLVAAACGGGGDDSSDADTKGSGGSTSTTVASREASLGSGSITWRRSPVGAPGAGNLDALATDGTRFVVVGLNRSEGPGVPIWWSDDGLIWTRGIGPASAFPAGTIATKVVYDGEKFVAFGRPKQGYATLAWSSANGKSWSAYHGSGLDVPSGAYPASVSVTDDGLLLLVVNPDTGYALWRSRGDTWRSLGAVTLEGGASAVVQKVAESGSTLVAAGHVDRAAAAWTSPDGSQWTRATIAGSDPESFSAIQDLVTTGSELVAVGVADNGFHEIPLAWYSSDGTQWQGGGPITAFSTEDGRSGGMDVATVADGGVVSAGHDGSKVALFTSDDGKAWKRVKDDPQLEIRIGSFAEPTGVAVANGHVVVAFREQRLQGTSTSLVGLGIVSGTTR